MNSCRSSFDIGRDGSVVVASRRSRDGARPFEKVGVVTDDLEPQLRPASGLIVADPQAAGAPGDQRLEIMAD
jgi:hypothetical protein